MKFSIITPTHERPEKLLRAVNSVLQQSHQNWEHIIINDAPGDDTHAVLSLLSSDSRIRFFENTQNKGVNRSRNHGLDLVAHDSTYIIFLDDDDYLSPDALARLVSLITIHQPAWLMTARGTTPTTPTTHAPHSGIYYSYAWDYLITKKITGDATHCIATACINGGDTHLRFPLHIKQAEEWIFYMALGTKARPYYEDIVTTLSEGYAPDGLNLRSRTWREQIQLLPSFIREGARYTLYMHVFFWIYWSMRLIRSFIR